MLVLPESVVARALAGEHALGVLPAHAGFFPTASRHRVIRPEGAAELILIYCTAGTGWAEVDGRDVHVTAGDLLLIPAEIPHAYGTSEAAPWTVHWMHLAGPACRAIEQLLASATAAVIRVGRAPEWSNLFEKVFRLLSESQSPESLFRSALAAAALLDRLVEAHQQAALVDDMDVRMADCIRLMWQRVNGSVTLDELAQAARLSASHFAASFKRHTKFPPLAYFHRLQMEQAAHLLDNTDLPVKAVATRVGYQDQLYFSRRFRKFHDVSPTQYRDARAPTPTAANRRR